MEYHEWGSIKAPFIVRLGFVFELEKRMELLQQREPAMTGI